MSCSSHTINLFPNEDFFYDIINSVPVGILILDNNTNIFDNDNKIIFSNSLAKKLLLINKDNDFKNFCLIAKQCKEYSVGITNNGITLYEFIFNSKISGNKKFNINNKIIYVKLKNKNSKIFLVIDSYDEERQKIQENFVSNMGDQYLSTLYHEINNPLNSLLITISDIIKETMPEIKRRIEFLVFLLKMFLKTFILFFQISTLTKENLKSNTTINLDSLMNKISLKYSQLYEYKTIKFINHTENLTNKCVNLDYYYFKNLIKSLFIYFYQHTKTGGNFTIKSQDLISKTGNLIKLTFSNNKSFKNTKRSYSTYDVPSIELLKNNIQTEKINLEIISKLSNCLNIKIELSKEKDINIYIPYEEDLYFNTISENENENNIIKNIHNINEGNVTFLNLTNSQKSEKELQNILKNKKRNNLKLNKKIYKKNNKRSQSVVQFGNNFEEFEIYKQEIISEENYVSSSSEVSEKENKEINNEEKKTISTNLSISQLDSKNSNKFSLKSKSINKNLKEICKNLNEVKNSNSDIFHLNVENISKTYKEEKEKNNIKKNDILIVDDEQFNLNSLSNILHKLNCNCDICYDGEDCIKLIKDQLNISKNNKCQYKLILMDIIMPIMNGLQTVETLQKMCNEKKINGNDINIIFISASLDQKDDVNNLKKKCPIIKDFLVKPIKISQIENVINNFYY